jgi:hypothetical protein
MKSLSIALKLWLPAIAVSVGLVAMAAGSAVRTIRSQAITVAEQSEQQSKLEMAARWRGLAEANALRGIGAALNADAAAGQLLLVDQEAANQEIARPRRSRRRGMRPQWGDISSPPPSPSSRLFWPPSKPWSR